MSPTTTLYVVWLVTFAGMIAGLLTTGHPLFALGIVECVTITALGAMLWCNLPTQ